jgi:hypothetical protein
MSDEWGPWIEHDGKGCPCLGAWAQTERLGKYVFPHTGTHRAILEGRIEEPANWDWSRFGERLPRGTVASKVIRYRIRKPRGLTILESLLADLPERVDA